MKKLVTMVAIPALCAGLASAQDRPGGTGTQDRPGGTGTQDPDRGMGRQGGMQGAEEGVQAGAQAPNFILQDVGGDTHNLREYLQDDKIVVLEWFDPLSPFSRKYHEQGDMVKKTFERFEGKDVVWLAVATFGIQDEGQAGQPGGQVRGQQGTTGQAGGTGGAAGTTGGETSRLATMNRDQAVKILEQATEDLKLEYPVLLDEGGNLAKLYGVREIPHIFIINKDGRVAYHGAIDNSRGLAQAGDVNYVSQALNQLTSNQPVSVPRSEPFGTSLPAGAPREGTRRTAPPTGGFEQPRGEQERKDRE